MGGGWKLGGCMDRLLRDVYDLEVEALMELCVSAVRAAMVRAEMCSKV